MPFFGTSESASDPTQNTQLLSLNQRLSVIEAYNAGNRLGILEAVNTASRLTALEGLNTASRLSTLEARPIPTLQSLGGEPAGTAAAAITAHKQQSDPHSQYLLDSELAAHIQAINPHQVTLQQVGGEPSGAEARSKTYTDEKVAALNNWVQNLAGLYPTSLIHFWGYGRCFNGTTVKSFLYQTATNYDFYRYATVASSALGDIVEFDAPLKSGNYRLRILHDKSSDRGIITAYINGVAVGTIDCYNASKINVNRTDFNFTITESKTHQIRITVIGKNGASSGHEFGCTAIFIAPQLTAVPYQLIAAGQFTTYFASDGRRWQTDRNFSGGNSFDIEANVGTFTVANTSDQRLYKWERSLDSGTFTYTIPLTAGLYSLKLHFAENYHSGAGLRVGSVSLNGTVVLSAFDIFVQAGGKHRALIKQFDNLNITTNLIITFTNTLINAIEIIRL